HAALANSIIEGKGAAGGSRRAPSSSVARAMRAKARVFRNAFCGPGRRTSVLPRPDMGRPTFDLVPGQGVANDARIVPELRAPTRLGGPRRTTASAAAAA